MHMPTIGHRFAVFAIALSTLATVGGPAALAQGVTHSGANSNSVDMIVGMPPGGSIDGYARLLQRHMPRYLPNTPTIVVQNKPGAGSLLAVIALGNTTPADGLVIGTFSSALIPAAITDPARFKVDFRHFKFLGNIGEDYRVCYFRTSLGIHNMKDLAARDQVIIGESAPGTSGLVNAAVLEDFFHVKVKEVRGYPGSADKRLAVERGEIDGDCGGIDLIPEEWLTEKKVNISLRFLPDLPEGVDPSIQFVGDLLTNPEDRKIYDLTIMPTRLVGTFIVPDSIGAEKVEVLRHAFDSMVKDANFLADAKQARLSVVPTRGADIDREVAALYGTPPDLMQRGKALLTR
jgi:hypothetical protein